MEQYRKWKDVLSVVSGKNQKTVANPTGQYPIYGSGGIMGRADDFLCEAGTTVVGRKGTINSPIFVNERFWNVDTAFGISPGPSLNPKFLYYFCRSCNFKALDKSTTIPSLAKSDLLNIEMPVPSIPEQERIVASIEELFSQLDSGVETLKKTKQQLAVYRQAVLKEAFDLATQSASDSTTQFLPIEQLLTTDRKGMSTGPFGTMIKKQDHRSKGVPMLGIENIGKGTFIDGNKIFVTYEKAQELSSFVVFEGDIIISRSGTVGEICAVPKRAEGALLSTNLMRISLDKKKICSDYFIYLFQSKGIVLDQIKELCKGSTRIFINQTILKQVMFPVPTLENQKMIVERIESCLSVCDIIEQTIDAALQHADALRQSILKKAFEGSL